MKKENIDEVMSLWLANKLDNVHTVLPGQIVNYEGHTTRKAEVKVMLKLRNVHNKIVEISPIKNVPVIFPCTKNFNILFPLKKNDGCLLLFSESAIGDFLLNANNTAIEAEDLNRFDLSDCICIPGLYSFTNNPDVSSLNSTDFWIQFQNATINIIDSTNEIILKTTTGKIKIESSGAITFDDGTESYVLGNKAQTELNKESANMTALKAAINAWVPVPNDGGAALKAALAAFLALPTENYASILSTLIKGK